MKKVISRISIIAITFIIAAVAVHFLTSQLKPKPKIILIGLDGADWKMIDSLSSRGQLPNIKRLIDGGVRGRLRSLEPILSPIIWTSIATGKTPEKHGITWFMVKNPKTKESIPVTSQMREAKALWNMISEAGFSVGTIGWWATWPAESVNGFIVSDHIAYHGFGLNAENVKTDVGKTYPESLLRKIEPLITKPRDIPKREIDRFMAISQEEYDLTVSQDFSFRNPLSHFTYALATAKTYLAVARKLQQDYDPNLFAVYFEGIDTIGHLYMKYMPPKIQGLSPLLFQKYHRVMPEYYRFQDELVGKLLEDSDEDTTIIIVSDHGFKTGSERLPEVINTDVKTAHLWHKIHGVLIMYGKNIKVDKEIHGASVLDITPTILYLMDLPVGEDMDGKILMDAISIDFSRKHPPKYVSTYEDADREGGKGEFVGSDIDDKIKERLAALGYIGGKDFSATEVHLNRAQAYHSRRQYAEAIGELNKILSKEPKNIKALINLGNIYEVQRRFAAAIHAYEKVAQQVAVTSSAPPSDVSEAEVQSPRFSVPLEKQPKGWTLNIENLSDESKQLFAAAYIGLGACYLNTGNAQEATENLEKAKELVPDDFKCRYNLGVVFENQDRIEDAIKEYKAALQILPSSPICLNNLGNCCQKLNDLGRAIEYYNRAAAAGPNHVESRYNLGVVYNLQNKHALAIEQFRDALALQANFAPALRSLANAYIEAKQYDLAIQQFTRLSSVQPRNPWAWYGIARAQALAGKQEEAKASLNHALRMDRKEVQKRLDKDSVLTKLLPGKRESEKVRK